MKTLYFAKEPWEEEYIKTKLPAETVFFGGAIGEVPNEHADAEIISVFVDKPLGAAEMSRFPKLKLIATRSTGFDHIDVAEAKKRGVAVATVPFYGENTVAEFAFALLLALSRRVCEAHEQVSETSSFSQRGLTGFDLMGKTLGVVGGGHIGMHSVKIANGFGMHVLVSDPHPDQALAQANNFAYASLDELLAQSDIVTLHVPYNAHTHHLLNAQKFALMKKGSYLINTARGGVVETAALVQALQDGTLAGAGLDVLEEEGEMSDEMTLMSAAHPKEEELKVMLQNHFLMTHPRVIVTPHIAFDTREALVRILDTTTANITGFIDGKPQNLLP